MTKYLALILICAFVAGTFAFEKCQKNPGPFPITYSFEGCKKPPCKIFLGDVVKLNAVFKAPHDVQKLKASLDAYKWIFPLPIDLEPEVEDACRHLKKGSCPFKAGEEIEYNLEFPITEVMMDVDAVAELSLKNEKEKVITCIRFDVEVKSSKRSK